MIEGNNYEKLNNCDYLDSNIQSSSDMILNCIGDKNSGQEKLCTSSYQKLYDNIAINSENISIKRGMNAGFGILPNTKEEKYNPKLQKKEEVVPLPNSIIDTTEGFTGSFITGNGPGKSIVKRGDCPEGYKRCSKTGVCIQVCTNCKYNNKMKSREFNEFDSCFPNGVYDGISDTGNIKCTCGENNQYCSDKFIAQGSFMSEGNIKNFMNDMNFFNIKDL